MTEKYLERKRVIKFGEAGSLIVPEAALLFFDKSVREAVKECRVMDELLIEKARTEKVTKLVKNNYRIQGSIEIIDCQRCLKQT